MNPYRHSSISSISSSTTSSTSSSSARLRWLFSRRLRSRQHHHGAKQIDNVKWVHEHSKQLSRFDSQQDVLKYVHKNHPLKGCAQFPMPSLRGDESIDELAMLADAVCIATVNRFTECDEDRIKRWMRTDDESDINETGVGNCAFMSLHVDPGNPNGGIYHDALHRWRRYKQKASMTRLHRQRLILSSLLSSFSSSSSSL